MDDMRIKTVSFDDLFEEYDGMIWNITYKIKKSIKTSFNADELHQFGLVGLWKASESFKPEKGIKFSTYAYETIKGNIRNGIAQEKETDLTRSQIKRKELVARLLIKKEANNWTWEETQIQSGLCDEKWMEAIELNKTSISFDAPVSSNGGMDDDRTLIEYVPSDFGIEEKIVLKETINELFTGLDELEQEIIQFRYIDGLNKKETSEKLQIAPTTFYRKEKLLLKKIVKQKRPALV